MDAINLMEKEMLRRNYSLKTIKTYSYCVNKFLKQYKNNPRKISKKDINDYLNNLLEKKSCGNTINVNLNALKFLLEEILNKKFVSRIKYSKTPKRLPEFLSKDEVVKLINVIENNKHKLMVKLLYGAGLRVSELTNLKVKDLELNNNYGWVRHGKGNKDRLFIIPNLLKNELIEHINKNNLDNDSWLFTTYNGHISTRTIQEIIKKATKKAKLNKKIHPHSLRHSYATHLIEDGYDLTLVQSLLGHKSPETTMVYVHMANPKLLSVKSPLDNLQLENNSEKLDYEFKNNKDTKVIT